MITLSSLYEGLRILKAGCFSSLKYGLQFTALVLICVSLVACGGDDDEDDSDLDGTNPQPTLAPSPTVEPSPTVNPTPTVQPSPTVTPTNTPDPDPDIDDADSDGVADEYDECPNTPAWREVNDRGCPLYEIVGDCIPSEEEEELILAHNEARSQSRNCGGEFREAVGPLRWDCQLANASRSHSEDMANNNFFSHNGSNGSSPFERMTDAGYRWRTAGENIAAGSSTARAAVDGWLNSPGHCNNIMAAGFEDMGAAKAENSNSQYRIYWTAGFATRF